jgi:hypothetical protein
MLFHRIGAAKRKINAVRTEEILYGEEAPTRCHARTGGDSHRREKPLREDKSGGPLIRPARVKEALISLSSHSRFKVVAG